MTTLSVFEIIATITGVICVALQSKEKILAWPFGIVSVTLSAYVFLHARLYSDMGLHIIYILLNVYGWYYWSRHEATKKVRSTTSMNWRQVTYATLVVVVFAMILGYLMGTFTNADLYYFDAFTTSGSLVAQYLLAKKYLQNWLFWMVVDCIAIPVYLYKGLFFFSLLFGLYLIICIYGYLSWKKNMSPAFN